MWRFADTTAKINKGLPVIQLDMDGNEIARFTNLDEACSTTGFHRSALLNCCKGRSKSSHGYVWKFIGEAPSFIGVIQLDLNGNEIARYSSLTDAMKATGHDRHRINECCKGLRESYKGFRWQFKEAEQPVVNQSDSGLFS